MYYFVVTVGRVPGIYYDWKSCQKQVRGISGGRFKKFELRLDAEFYYRMFLTDGNRNALPATGLPFVTETGYVSYW